MRTDDQAWCQRWFDYLKGRLDKMSQELDTVNASYSAFKTKAESAIQSRDAQIANLNQQLQAASAANDQAGLKTLNDQIVADTAALPA